MSLIWDCISLVFQYSWKIRCQFRWFYCTVDLTIFLRLTKCADNMWPLVLDTQDRVSWNCRVELNVDCNLNYKNVKKVSLLKPSTGHQNNRRPIENWISNPCRQCASTSLLFVHQLGQHFGDISCKRNVPCVQNESKTESTVGKCVQKILFDEMLFFCISVLYLMHLKMAEESKFGMQSIFNHFIFNFNFNSSKWRHWGHNHL